MLKAIKNLFNMEHQIVSVQPLIDITALTLETGFVTDSVDGYRPSSLLFIARPESGKTTTINAFQNLPFVYYTNEITVKTLVDKFLPQASTQQYRFLLVPDILNCVQKQCTTREPFLNTVKSMVDEGVTRIETPFKTYTLSTVVKAGVITGITRSSFYATQGRYSLDNDLKRMGFASRMIPFSYDYPIDKLVNILNYIESGQAKENSGVTIPKIKQPKNLIKFEPKLELFKQLEIISTKLGEESDAYGLRAQKNLQKLCYANAVLNGRKEVNQNDIDKLMSLAKWMNFKFNSL